MSLQKMKQALETMERTWQGGKPQQNGLRERLRQRLWRFLQLGQQDEYNAAAINGLYAVSEHMESFKQQPATFDALREQISAMQAILIQHEQELAQQQAEMTNLQVKLAVTEQTLAATTAQLQSLKDSHSL